MSPSQLTLDSLNRRQFLRLVASSAGAAAAMQLSRAYAADPKSAYWAFFSDTHIKTEDDHEKVPVNHGYYDPHAHIKQCVKEALAAKPEGMIITGDLARLTGGVENYKKLSEFLQPLTGKMPIYSAMGNHDNRDQFAQVFATHAPEEQSVPHKHVQVIERDLVRFVILDSCKATNVGQAFLGKEQIDWLRAYLAKCDDRPTLLCFHHDPTRDKEFPENGQLYEVIKPCKKVKACLYGHTHEYHYNVVDGIHMVNLPAMGYSFNLKDPVGWVDARFTAEGGAFTMHVTAGPKEEDGKAHRLKWR